MASATSDSDMRPTSASEMMREVAEVQDFGQAGAFFEKISKSFIVSV